ncbi:MAG TPA: NAD-dependent deacylase [Variovorax sp.]|nr:NAD-dependent deacylase [Variovorax sp.]
MPPELLAPDSIVDLLESARRVVVLTGAGMSAESGIPTFRDAQTGLWARFDPYALASPEGFARDPETVWAWYESRRRQVKSAQPHPGHVALARLAALPRFDAFTVVTQNVDDLHERAGCDNVIHLHGSLFAPRCQACAAPYRFGADALDADPPPRLAPPTCSTCGGRVRPGVVWFGEALPEQAWQQAMQAAGRADAMLVIGTSSQVYPAAGLPQEVRHRGGGRVAVINPDEGVRESSGDLIWNVTAGAGIPALLARLAG